MRSLISQTPEGTAVPVTPSCPPPSAGKPRSHVTRLLLTTVAAAALWLGLSRLTSRGPQERLPELPPDGRMTTVQAGPSGHEFLFLADDGLRSRAVEGRKSRLLLPLSRDQAQSAFIQPEGGTIWVWINDPRSQALGLPPPPSPPAKAPAGSPAKPEQRPNVAPSSGNRTAWRVSLADGSVREVSLPASVPVPVFWREGMVVQRLNPRTGRMTTVWQPLEEGRQQALPDGNSALRVADGRLLAASAFHRRIQVFREPGEAPLTLPVTTAGPSLEPVLHGDRVAWLESRPHGHVLASADLRSGSRREIALGTSAPTESLRLMSDGSGLWVLLPPGEGTGMTLSRVEADGRLTPVAARLPYVVSMMEVRSGYLYYLAAEFQERWWDWSPGGLARKRSMVPFRVRLVPR